MAKKDNNTEDKPKIKAFPNQLKLKKGVDKLQFIGVNGRFGMTAKNFVDFSFDELCEFKLSHDATTANKFLIGIIPPNYKSPFDKAPPKLEE